MNPMLGHRGCRLGITYPEITRMQARAILEAACRVKKEGIDVKPEIMIPLVGHVNELADQAKVVRDVAKKVFESEGVTVDFLVGTMIELPRAALTADEIAREAEFFSFGTNDLTQTTFGLSRDDAGKFLPDYVRREILPADPFEKLDQGGVGKLVKMGVELGRSTRAGPQGRHLRRARRRPVERRVLPPDGPRLRVLLAVPGPDRAPRGGAGGAEEVVSRRGARGPSSLRRSQGRGGGPPGRRPSLRPSSRPSRRSGPCASGSSRRPASSETARLYSASASGIFFSFSRT